MCFFRISVPSKTIPLGGETPDGKLMWIPADRVLSSPYELVDDLHYCFTDIVEGKTIFFASAEVGPDEKIVRFVKSSVPVQ